MNNLLTQQALKALLYEVVTLPKPGLVDPLDHTTHPDMDIYRFIDSILSLENYFNYCANVSSNFKGNNLTYLFNKIRQAGIQAEKDMFIATNNVNTHKGAIFSLGILVSAFAYSITQNHTKEPQKVQVVIKKMLTNLLSDFQYNKLNNKILKTAGEQQFIKYHLYGARGEAAAGFPTIFKYGFPYLKNSTGCWQNRLLDTLMYLAKNTKDSNLLKRSNNPQIFKWLNKKIDIYFKLGGANTKKGKKYLYYLNNEFNNMNYSLGGTADMLIASIFVYLIEK